ncbi:MAG: hypothetical protein N3I35_15130 [Clostridia bacterium]|nr:hypothetical protein [Clostridia bacterium]
MEISEMKELFNNAIIALPSLDKSKTISVKGLLELISINTEGLILPQASIVLNTLKSITKTKVLEITGMVQIDNCNMNIVLSIAKNEQTKGVSITLDFEGESGQVLSFSESLNSLLPQLSLSNEYIPVGLDLSLRKISLSYDTASKKLNGTLKGIAAIDKFSIDISGKIADKEASLSFSIPSVSLRKAVSILVADADVPGILPEIILDNMSFTVSSKSGFTVKGTSSLTCWEWDIGTGHPFNAQIRGELLLKREPGKSIMLVFDVIGEGDVILAENDLYITSIGLKLRLNADKTWSVSGNTVIVLLGEPFTLDAVYEKKTEKLTLSGAAKNGGYFRYILEDIGEIAFKDLKIILQKNVKKFAFSVEGEGGIKIYSLFGVPGMEQCENLLNVNMAVSLFYDQKNYGIVLRPDKADLTIPIPAPVKDGAIFFDIMFGGLPESDHSTKGGGIFLTKNEISASVKLRFRGLPEELYALVPKDGSTATLKISNKGAELGIDRITAPVEIAIPPLTTNDPSTGEERMVDLGKALIDMTDLKLILGKEIQLSVLFGVGIPQLLNKIFGIKEDGSPSVEFFNTYDARDEASKEETTIKMKLSIGTEGVSATIVGKASPIKAIKLNTENDKTWIHCNLGEFGQASFQMPVLSLDAKSGSFRASGGFDVTKPLALPLTPFKALFELAGLKDLSNMLPNSISMYLAHQFEHSEWPDKAMPRPSLLDSQGNLDTAEIKRVFTGFADSMAVKIPDELLRQFDMLGDCFDSLPEKLRQYLQFEMPKSFSFDLSVTIDGGITFEAGVKDGDEPLKIIFPATNGFGPILVGIELTKVAFGEILSGNFFTLEAGVCVDVFDISQIIAALVLKKVSDKIPVKLPVCAPDFIHTRIILDDVYMIIDYKTVAMITDVPIPIPIPVFFKQLGIVYTDLSGAEIRANTAFPKPKLDLSAFGKILLQLKDFFTKHDSMIVPEKLNTDMDLRFILNQNFITLPQFIGGSKLSFDGLNGENSSLAFNGKSRLEISYPEKYLQAFTIELWFRRYREGAEVEVLAAGSRMETFEIHLGGESGSNSVRFIPIPGFYVDTTAECFTSEHWVHLACVYDPRQMPKPARIYINGIEQKTTQQNIGIRHTLKDTPFNGLFIGCRGNKKYYFEGEITDIRLWNKARTGSEIRENMSFRLLSTEENLIGNWPLLDGGGTDKGIYDLTRNSSYTKKCETSWSRSAPFTNDRLELSLLAVCAAFMNSMKRLNINELIRTIPLNYRIGYLHLPASVIPLDVEAAWMVATPDEFESVSGGTICYAGDEASRQVLEEKISEFRPVRKDLLELLDVEQRTNAILNQINTAPDTLKKVNGQGLAIFLKGRTSFRGLQTGEYTPAAFGENEISVMYALTTSNSKGFATGYKIAAKLKDIFDIEAFGHISVNNEINAANPNNAVKLIGYGHLDLPALNHRPFKGFINYIHNILEFEGQLALFPEDFFYQGLKYQIEGALKGYLSKENFYFFGSVNCNLGSLRLEGASVYISPEHAYAEGTWMGASARLDIIKTQYGIGLEGNAGISHCGFNAFANIKIDTSPLSLKIGGTIADVRVEPFLKVTGLKENEGAAFTMEFKDMNPVMVIEGKAELLGVSAETNIHASTAGFSFDVSGKLFEMFDCKLEAEGLMINDPTTFKVKGTFIEGEQGYCTYIRNSAVSIINSLMDSANTVFENINTELSKRQEELRQIDDRINSRKSEVLAQIEESSKNIEALKRTVEGFQYEVDKIQNNINELQERKSKLGREIEQLNRRPWWEQWDLPVQVGSRVGEQIAIDAEIVVMRVSQEGVRASLELAKIALSMAQSAISVLPVELDPEILILTASKETILQAIEMLKLSLKGTNTIFHAGGGLLAEYIRVNGATDILKVDNAEFECKLEEIKNSEIDIRLKNVEFMGNKVFDTLECRFDFSNPIKSMQELITGKLL